MTSPDDPIDLTPDGAENRQPPDDDIIDISHEDLLDVEPLQPPAPTAGLPAEGTPLGAPLPSVPQQPPLAKKKSAAEVAVTAALNILPLAVAGGLGGLLAWGLAEPFVVDRPGAASMTIVLREMAAFFALLGACIGACIGTVDGITTANLRRTFQGAGLGLAIGAVCGAFGGIFGQLVYSGLGAGRGSMLLTIIARSVGWAVVGAGVGVAPGILARAKAKIINGIIGGLAGGALGGFLFDPIAAVVGSGELSRMIAMTALGAAAGAAIGVVEEVAKQAWLVITAGPLAGKQFILYNPVTTIGSSYKCDIALVKDQTIAAVHCTIDRSSGRSVLVAQPGAPTFVNGRPVTRHALRDGDVIQIGQTALTFYERATTPTPGPTPL